MRWTYDGRYSREEFISVSKRCFNDGFVVHEVGDYTIAEYLSDGQFFVIKNNDGFCVDDVDGDWTIVCWSIEEAMTVIMADIANDSGVSNVTPQE